MHVLLRPAARYEERALHYRDDPIGGTRPPGPRRMQSSALMGGGRGAGMPSSRYPFTSWSPSPAPAGWLSAPYLVVALAADPRPPRPFKAPKSSSSLP